MDRRKKRVSSKFRFAFQKVFLSITYKLLDSGKVWIRIQKKQWHNQRPYNGRAFKDFVIAKY